MKWSKQTYNMVVTIIAEELYWVPLIKINEDNQREVLMKEAMMQAVQAVLQRFCDVFQHDNPRFDQARFYDAFLSRGMTSIDILEKLEESVVRHRMENPSQTAPELFNEITEEAIQRFDIGKDVDQWPMSYNEEPKE